jgi:hypothetical protein
VNSLPGTVLDEVLKIRSPFEIGCRRLEQEVQILGKAVQSMQDSETGPSVKAGHIKEAIVREATQEEVLQDFSQYVLLFNCISRSVVVHSVR